MSITINSKQLLISFKANEGVLWIWPERSLNLLLCCFLVGIILSKRNLLPIVLTRLVGSSNIEITYWVFNWSIVIIDKEIIFTVNLSHYLLGIQPRLSDLWMLIGFPGRLFFNKICRSCHTCTWNLSCPQIRIIHEISLDNNGIAGLCPLRYVKHHLEHLITLHWLHEFWKVSTTTIRLIQSLLAIYFLMLHSYFIWTLVASVCTLFSDYDFSIY